WPPTAPARPTSTTPRTPGCSRPPRRGCSATRPGACPTSSRPWPTTGSGSPSTAGPSRSPSPPRLRCASRRRRAPSAEGLGHATTDLLVVERLRSGVDPREGVAEQVAPVLPVVAVTRLDPADRHPGLLEGRHHGAVRGDERLVDAAAHE